MEQYYQAALAHRTWAARFWNGGPTKFLTPAQYEQFLLLALREHDTTLLTTILDEVDEELMADVVARLIAEGDCELLEWLVTQPYPPLMRELTPEILAESPDVAQALVDRPVNFYRYYQWWMGWPEQADVTRLFNELFTPGSLPVVRFADLSTDLREWRTYKKKVLLEWLAARQNPSSPASPASPSRPTLPRRQGY